MKDIIAKSKKYIRTYVLSLKWLRSLMIPALLCLVGFNFLEIKIYQTIGIITTKVDEGSSKFHYSMLFCFYFIVGYSLKLLYEIFNGYFIAASIKNGLTNFFGEYLNIDYKSFYSIGIGEAQFNINRRVYALIEFLSSVCVDFISNFLFFLIAFGSLGNEIKSVSLKTFILGFICIFLFISSFVQILRSIARSKLNTGYEISSRKMYDILYNYERIVSYDNLDEELEKYKESMNYQVFWGSVFWVTYEFVYMINCLIFLELNRYLLAVLGTSKTETIDIKGFTLVFGKLKEEVLDMIDSVDSLANSFVNLDQSIIENCPLDEKENTMEVEHETFGIKGEDINFKYSTKEILKNLKINIEQGQKIAISGVNGSGKSTLTKLLVGFYDYEGSIKIGGIEMNMISKKSIRETISYLPQNAFLFDSTILDNLKYSNPTISDEKVIEYCKQYGTHELFKTLGYNKMVGERGKNLSGGQRQKICFMRAVLKNSQILILDEATSNMDEASELAIVHAIKEYMSHKTVIMIVHNLSLLKHFDKVVYLGPNHIVEEGKFEDLIESKTSNFKEFYYNSIKAS